MSLFFGFVQFEFTHAIGPGAGRYVVQSANGDPQDQGEVAGPSPLRRPQAHVEEEAFDASGRHVVTGTSMEVGSADVLVVHVVEAPHAKGTPRFGRSPKVRRVDAQEDTGQVPLLRVSYVLGTSPIADKNDATRRLQALSEDAGRQQRLIDDGLAVVNRAIRGYRAGAHDPYVLEISRRDARRIRIGFGTTTDVSNGTWRDAIEIPEPNPGRSNRTDRLRPSETMAAVLAGRGQVLESEDLLLRAMVDLDHGRTRAAALQAYSALELLRAESPEAGAYMQDRRKLADRAEEAKQLAGVAVQGPLTDEQRTALEQLIEHIELSIESWRFSDSRY